MERVRTDSEHLSRVPSLDGLRAVSISFVLVSHLIRMLDFVSPTSPIGLWADNLGALGVRTFFVISGFLITSLLLSEQQSTHSIHLGRFYLRRTLRILPPYFFLLLVIVALATFKTITLAPYDLIHAFTYTTNYYSGRSWYVGHGWSLSVEEQFYLAWPAALLVLGRKHGLRLACAFLLISPVVRLAYLHFLPFGITKFEIAYRFETVADSLAMGCLLSGLYEVLIKAGKIRRSFESRLFILVPLAVLYVSSSISLQHSYLPAYLLFGITIQNLGIAASVAWCVMNSEGRVGRLLNWRPIVFVGVMSYSIYLWQQPFLVDRSTSTPLKLLTALVLVAAASLFSHYAVERPALRVRRRVERRLFGSGGPVGSRGVDLLERGRASDVPAPLAMVGTGNHALGEDEMGNSNLTSVGGGDRSSPPCRT